MGNKKCSSPLGEVPSGCAAPRGGLLQLHEHPERQPARVSAEPGAQAPCSPSPFPAPDGYFLVRTRITDVEDRSKLPGTLRNVCALTGAHPLMAPERGRRVERGWDRECVHCWALRGPREMARGQQAPREGGHLTSALLGAGFARVGGPADWHECLPRFGFVFKPKNGVTIMQASGTHPEVRKCVHPSRLVVPVAVDHLSLYSAGQMYAFPGPRAFHPV